jgi:hypothetical protein
MAELKSVLGRLSSRFLAVTGRLMRQGIAEADRKLSHSLSFYLHLYLGIVTSACFRTPSESTVTVPGMLFRRREQAITLQRTPTRK